MARLPRLNLFVSRRHSPGTAPGTMPAHLEKTTGTFLRAIGFGAEGHEEVELSSLEEIPALRERHENVWLQVVSTDRATLEGLGRVFELHPLLLEDVANLGQRTKIDSYDRNLFIVAWNLGLFDGTVDARQVSLVLGENYLISFQQEMGRELDPVRERLARGRARIRTSGPDYVCYALLDAIVDHYFPVMEEISGRIEELEDKALEARDSSVATEIQDLKRLLLSIRKLVWPLREVINRMLRDEPELVKETAHPYLRDCQDHALQVIEITESYRELASGLMDLYLSSVSNRMNEVMKVLTVIATIFIPMTFISSIYGMNFNTESPYNMPELAWRYGYPVAIGLMLLFAVVLLVFFRRKGWLRAS